PDEDEDGAEGERPVLGEGVDPGRTGVPAGVRGGHGRTSMSRVDGCGGRHPRRVPSPDGGGHTTFVGRTGGPRYGAAVPTRLWSVVFAAADPPSLARFWSVATGWPAEADGSGVVVVEAPAGSHEPGIPLVFVPNADPKVGKNRVHLDLDSRSADDQAATVERLRAAGARP